jgi:hypothetical protein
MDKEEREAAGTVNCLRQIFGDGKPRTSAQAPGEDEVSTKLANPLYESETQDEDGVERSVLVEDSEADFYDTMIASDEEGEEDTVTYVHQLRDLDEDYVALFAEFDVTQPHGCLNKKEMQRLIHARYPLVTLCYGRIGFWCASADRQLLGYSGIYICSTEQRQKSMSNTISRPCARILTRV